MTEPSQPISTSFIGYFKLGDNIVFNTKILDSLYKNLDVSQPIDVQAITIKPIVLIGVSAIEALIYDFVDRIKDYPKEFKHVDSAKISSIRKLDTQSFNWKFRVGIDKFRQHKMLGDEPNYYDNLDFLRNLRNRIHIQNQFAGRSEEYVWTSDVLYRCEACLEYTLLYLSENYPREDKDYVESIQVPWKRHFPNPKLLDWSSIPVPAQ